MAATSPSRSVLVIDDCLSLGRWARDAFGNSKFEVASVPSVEEGVRRLRQRWFDIVVVGARPQGTGASQLQAVISEQHPDSSLVAVSTMLQGTAMDPPTLNPWGYHCVVICAQKSVAGTLRTMVDEVSASPA